MSRQTYSDEELIEELRRVDGLVDGPVSRPEFGELSDVGRSTVSTRFGGWNAAKNIAGLETNKAGNQNPQSVSRKRQKAKIRQVKEPTNCYRCGIDVPPVALDFHHVGDNKEYNVSQMGTMEWSTVKEEMKKCVLLCANCHRMVEHNEINL
jgi:hypothetical protein